PDLRGRIPTHQGSGSILAETGGSEEITLTVSQIPAHSHPLLGSTDTAGGANAANSVLGQSDSVTLYRAVTPTVSLSPQVIASVGGSQPHTNFQPYLCVNFIISLFGIFP